MSQSGQEVHLEIADNGVGLPEAREMREVHSMGFRLIRGLVNQLGSGLDIHNQEGFVIQVKFMAGNQGRLFQSGRNVEDEGSLF